MANTYTKATQVEFIPDGDGALPRTIKAELDELVVNVRRMGATGDGRTDDTTNINKALQWAAGRASVLFPGGVYRVNAAGNKAPFPTRGGLVVPSHSHLVFAPGAKIEVIPNALPFSVAISLYGVENVTIEGAHVVGDRDRHTYPNWFDTLGDLVAGVNWRTKEDYAATFTPREGMVAHIPGGEDAGRYAFRSGAWVRTGAYSDASYGTHEFGYGLSIQDSRDVWVERCTFEDCTGDGIFIGQHAPLGPGELPTRRITVSRSTFARCRRQGISIVCGDDVKVETCHFEQIGVRQNGQDGAAPRSGIDVESGGKLKSSNVTVTDCTFRDCAGPGFIQYDGDCVTLTSCTFDGCGLVYVYAVNSTFANNTFYDGGINGASGSPRNTIAFTYAQAGTVVTATMASAHGLVDGQRAFLEFFNAAGLRVASGRYVVSVVSATVVTADVGKALALPTGGGSYAFPANNLTLANNTIHNGSISVNGVGITLRGNGLVVGGNATFGIYVGEKSEDVSIEGGRVEGGSRGVWVLPGAKRIKVSQVRFRNVDGYAIDSGGTRVTIAENEVYDSSGGIRVTTAPHRVSGNTLDLAGFLGSRRYAIDSSAVGGNFVTNNQYRGGTINSNAGDTLAGNGAY